LASDTRHERVASDWAQFFGVVKLAPGGLRVSPLAELERGVRLEAQGSAVIRRDGDAFVVPVGRGWRMSGRYAGQARRSHDVVLGAKRVYRERWRLELAVGMRALSIPKSAHIEHVAGNFVRRVEQKGQIIVIDSELRLSAGRVAVTAYPSWRRFCQQVDAHGSPLVLVAP
jgi:hypothetical protein